MPPRRKKGEYTAPSAVIVQRIPYVVPEKPEKPCSIDKCMEYRLVEWVGWLCTGCYPLVQKPLRFDHLIVKTVPSAPAAEIDLSCSRAGCEHYWHQHIGKYSDAVRRCEVIGCECQEFII